MEEELLDVMADMEAHYFDIGTASNPNIQLGGYGFTQLDENSNPTEVAKQYINQASKTNKITGFDDEFPITADMIKNEPVVEYFYDIFRNRKKGVDAQVPHIIVELWNKVSDNVYKARRQVQTAVITGKTITPGENMVLSGSLKSVSDFEYGTFNVSTKTFTATPVSL